MSLRANIGFVFSISLITFIFFVWSAVFAAAERRLVVSFLDVGQGDAILIESPSGRTMLIDGGPDGSVLRELAKRLPWWERSLDVVLATHPDQDHIGGLPSVLERYRVRFIVRSDVEDDGADAAALKKSITEEKASGARELLARRGDVIDLGGGAYLEVLFPDRSLPRVDPNTASIVARLVYGETAFLLSGDAPAAVERYLASLDREGLHADVFKAGHHGSRTSSDPLFIGFASSVYAVVSRGCDNRYGHPHTETLERLKVFDAQVFDTCKEGTITFVSDGVSVSRE